MIDTNLITLRILSEVLMAFVKREYSGLKFPARAQEAFNNSQNTQRVPLTIEY